MIDAATKTAERYAKQAERTARHQGWGATDGGRAIVERYLRDANASITRMKAEASSCRNRKGLKGNPSALLDLDDTLLALVAMQGGVSAVSSAQTLTQALLAMGRAAANECLGKAMTDWDRKRAEKIAKGVRLTHASTRGRAKAATTKARKLGFTWEEWTDRDHLAAGKFLMEALLATDAFVLDQTQDMGMFLSLTEEAVGVSQALVQKMIESAPVLLPMKEKPEPWTQRRQVVQGFRMPLIRRRDKTVQAALNAAIKDKSAQPLLDSVNRAQDVAYRINTDVLAIMEWCVDQKVRVPGLPGEDFVIPEQPPEDWTREQKFVRWKAISELKDVNRALAGERLTFASDMEIAHWLGSDPFWTPMNLDYRGRLYGMTMFNFQRQDYVRALFNFAEGKPLGPHGLRWLKVHLANCGAFEKIDKASFADRVAWVDAHQDQLLAVAADPKANQWWFQADAPFLFLAACRELAGALQDPEGYVCALPVSFDGSCSGLQHLCAMTRANEGYLVNLVPMDKPQDVYMEVANRAAARVKDDLLSTTMLKSKRRTKDAEGKETVEEIEVPLRDIAAQVDAFGVGRSLVKRNVMTYSYSSKKFGMSQQHVEDTMRPLGLKVLSGELAVHPFGADSGMMASRYLGGLIYDAIETVVQKPAEAMGFLQDLAKVCANEGLPVRWTTPMGLPVVVRCPNFAKEQLALFMNDRGVSVRFSPVLSEEAPGIDKAKAAAAIAPCFVHSMDACHLQMVVLEAHKRGIDGVALVHDSFGCVPGDAQEFREVIKDTFYQLYSEHDVLQDIREETLAQLSSNRERVPNVPEYGTLDISEIKHSEYAFA